MVQHGTIDLAALLRRIAGEARTEATLQSDIHTLLTAADLNLDEADVADVTLEAQTAGKRIDVEVGHACIEVKKELRPGASLDRAVEQLRGYVTERTQSLGQRYTGILTDGTTWQLYHLAPTGLALASSYVVSAIRPDVDGFTAWLAGVLTTEERLAPTHSSIMSRLGATSSGHQLEQADLRALYDANRDRPELVVKRELWARLLRTALGAAFDEDDHELFVEHTLLVATAETIAHAVLGFPIVTMSADSLLGGDLFSRRAQILGVVEHDFFDWPLDCGEAGRRWVSGLARRLAQFDWAATEHDAMKTIYESVITKETRKRLGEYYTPDWLAEKMVAVTIDDPLTSRVIDPSCGSGTFVFHAVRNYLAAADAAGHDNPTALAGVISHVAGMDLHPVAATLARVTYLLAIGPERLQGDRGPLRIPIYLGDSLQWGQRRDLFTSETLSVDTDDGLQLFADQLRFPERLLDDADRFDQLVAEMADAASNREKGSAHPDIAVIARRHALSGPDLEIVAETFERMCRLHDEGRDHIWGYFIRNTARPAWLSRPGNRVDVLIGNPPWLAYRFMTAAMQGRFRKLATDRRLWAGGSVATQQDLSDLFVARTIEQFLRDGGRFSFVMPNGVLTRGQYEGFRTGLWPTGDREAVGVIFEMPWDLAAVTPYFFPRTSAVVHGRRCDPVDVVAMGVDVEVWRASLTGDVRTWAAVAPQISIEVAQLAEGAEDVDRSLYRERFTNGATIFPRVLTTVREGEAAPVGTGAGRRPVRSFRGTYEKAPWKHLDDLEGVVEEEFVHPLILGENVLPYRLLPPAEAVLPVNRAGHLVDPTNYPGLADWWGTASRLWDANRSSSMSLAENVDYRRKLTQQYPLPPHRVVMAHSAMHVLACRVTVDGAVVEHQLDWCAVQSVEEGRYVCAVLNSPIVTTAAAPHMTSGKGGGRHIGKALWNVPIPLFDDASDLHGRLADAGRRAEEVVAELTFRGRTHGAMRREIRVVLAASIGPEIDSLVTELLGLG